MRAAVYSRRRHDGPVVPQQENGFDCGIFMTHFVRARCVALPLALAVGKPWDFSQDDVPDLRQRLTWDIVSAGASGRLFGHSSQKS